MVIAIIDHLNHQLFIEFADEQIIQDKFKGEEEDYIRDKYGFNDNDLYSWEYLTEKIEVFGTLEQANKEAHKKMLEEITHIN
jgi:hypothetical protein